MSKQTRRLVLSIMAQESHGKTHTLLTMPAPLVVYGLDPNTEAVIEKMFKVDDVADVDPDELRYVRIPYPLVTFDPKEDEIKAEAKDSWYTMIDDLAAIRKAKVKPASVGFDSGTLLDRLNVLRIFGRTDQIPPKVRQRKFGEVNSDFRGLFDVLEHLGINVGITHRVKEVWETVTVRSSGGPVEKDQVVPGKFQRIGFKEMGYMCNVEILMKFDPEREGKLSDKFGVEFLRSRQRPILVGESFWGKVDGVPVTSVPYIATLLYPGTTVKDWE